VSTPSGAPGAAIFGRAMPASGPFDALAARGWAAADALLERERTAPAPPAPTATATPPPDIVPGGGDTFCPPDDASCQ